jgi:hypothetical protein
MPAATGDANDARRRDREAAAAYGTSFHSWRFQKLPKFVTLPR